MPIVIMPNGEMVDSVTGNPVNTPTNRVIRMENNMGQLIANRPMQGQQQQMPMGRVGQGMTSELTVMEKMQMLMDMGLTEGEAIDAIAMEESAGSINPNAFSGMNRDEALKGAQLLEWVHLVEFLWVVKHLCLCQHLDHKCQMTWVQIEL